MLTVVQDDQAPIVAELDRQLIGSRRAGHPDAHRVPASAARPMASRSDSAASSTHHTPPAILGPARSADTANARRVLPTPAEPTRVTSRSSAIKAAQFGDLLDSTDQRGELNRQVVTVRRRATAARRTRSEDPDGRAARRAQVVPGRADGGRRDHATSPRQGAGPPAPRPPPPTPGPDRRARSPRSRAHRLSVWPT